MAIERYQRWRDYKGNFFLPVPIDGREIIKDRNLNKGTGFSKREREIFHLEGLLPPTVSTFEEQKARVYEGFCSASTNINKYIFLRSLQDRNETLFFGLLADHIEEMLPIVYIPTVVLACRQFSHHYQRARGLYITQDNVDSMHEMINHFPSKDIRVIVVTDSQGILGMEDMGVGGMEIPIGKLSLYTLGAGIHSSYSLPITLDIGTDNLDLIKDPLYLGISKKRIHGEEYEVFIEKFVTNVKKYFPSAILQWEDFKDRHAFKNLEKYRNFLPSFNDDIQGTGAVVLASVLSGVKIKKETLEKQTFVLYGAGCGGVGAARAIHYELTTQGMDTQAAYDKIILMDSDGIVLNDRKDLEDFKKPFAKDRSFINGWSIKSDQPSLLEALENTKATVLIGLSGQKGDFKAEHTQAMLKTTERPLIFPLSMPDEVAEATPAEIFNWSDGKAIAATGIMFPDLQSRQKIHQVGTATNAFIFPGVGLAAFISGIGIIRDDVFNTAARTLSNCVTSTELENGVVFPRIRDLKKVSTRVACEVLRLLIKQNPKELVLREDEIYEVVQDNLWTPAYFKYRKV